MTDGCDMNRFKQFKCSLTYIKFVEILHFIIFLFNVILGSVFIVFLYTKLLVGNDPCGNQNGLEIAVYCLICLFFILNW